MSDRYDGWVIKNKWGTLLLWTIATKKREVKKKVTYWKEWEIEGNKIVKVKLVEVNDER